MYQALIRLIWARRSEAQAPAKPTTGRTTAGLLASSDKMECSKTRASMWLEPLRIDARLGVSLAPRRCAKCPVRWYRSTHCLSNGSRDPSTGKAAQEMLPNTRVRTHANSQPSASRGLLAGQTLGSISVARLALEISCRQRASSLNWNNHHDTYDAAVVAGIKRNKQLIRAGLKALLCTPRDCEPAFRLIEGRLASPVRKRTANSTEAI